MMTASRTFPMILAVLATMLHGAGCVFKKAKIPPPAMAVPQPGPLAKPEALETPPEIEAPTDVSAAPAMPEMFAIELPDVPPPKPPRPPAPKPSPPQPSPQPETPAVTQVPQLIPLLTAAERSRRNHEIDEYIRRAEYALSQIGGRRLNVRQQTEKARAETFVRQARETRVSDLVTASNLSQRAALLAEGLVATLR